MKALTPKIVKCLHLLCSFALLSPFVSTFSARPQVAKAPQAPLFPVDADGTVHVPTLSIPDTPLMSKEGNDSRSYYIRSLGDPDMIRMVEGRAPLFAPFMERARRMFALNIEDTKIAGVHVLIYTPKDGVSARNKDRVLINLHGGGFTSCWLDCGQLESMPVAYYGKIKVVSVEYRQGPEFKFPAASEDVAKVYAELIKTYKPLNTGIYGCSAGGALTGESVAWFEKENIPMPGAVGILCAGGGGPSGDSKFTAAPLGERRLFDLGSETVSPLPYFSQADMKDPLVSPVTSPAVLAKFPPTLVVTGTRAAELSSAVYMHAQLVKAGVDAELFVVEGGRHGFWYDPGVPESKDVADDVIRFFDRHLGQGPQSTAAKTPSPYHPSIFGQDSRSTAWAQLATTSTTTSR